MNANVKLRSVKIPLNRQRPLKEKWNDIRAVNLIFIAFINNYYFIQIMDKQLGLVFMADPKKNPLTVDMYSPTNDEVKLQKGMDFLGAFSKGFEFADCVSLIRMDGLYIRTVYLKHVKRTMKVL